MRRLQAERGEIPQPVRANPPQPRAPAAAQPQRAPEPAYAAQDHGGEPNPAPVAEPGDEPLEELPEGTPPEGEPLEEEADPNVPPELAAARAEIERLQKRERELTGDYTRKTMKLAESGRQLEQDGVVVRNAAQTLAGMIEHPVQQFAQVNWAQLQVQAPEKYHALRQQYEQVVRARDNVMQLVEQMEAQQAEALERHRQQVAEVSRDILKTRVPGWSNQTYAALRDLAVADFGYTADEIDRTIDHRFIELLHAVHHSRSAKDKLLGVDRKAPQNKPQGANRQVIRNTQGQFQNARQRAMNSPGDKQAFRSMFAAKLAAERQRNGG
jgi:hypothetical protein